MCSEGTWEQQLGVIPWEPSIMTVCIAAICERGHALVLAGDREIGVGITSAEFADGKWHPLGTNWSIGISGTVSNATDVIAHSREVPAFKAPAAPTSLKVQAAIEKSYQKARLARAEARYLASRGWTLDEFKKDGSRLMSASVYATVDAQIATFDFNADLILAGFGEDDEGPAILTVKNPGVSTDHSKIGFWAVGSGAVAAQMSLFAREYSWAFSPEKAAYCVLEAKLAAAAASGVGPTTDIYLVVPGINPIAIQPDSMKKMKEIWEEIKPKEYSSEHWKLMRELNEFKILRSSIRV